MKGGGRHRSGTASVTYHDGRKAGGHRRRRVFHQRERRPTDLGGGQPSVTVLRSPLYRQKRRARCHTPTVVDDVRDGGRQIRGRRHQQAGITQRVEQDAHVHDASGAGHLAESMRGISSCTVLPTRSRVPAAGRVRTSEPRAILT